MKSSKLQVFLAVIVVFQTSIFFLSSAWRPLPEVLHLTTSTNPPSFTADDTDDDQTASPPRDEGMAACLLVMDDNHFLIEWLAYHSFVLPLSHLIIAVDPRSRTSPALVLERYRDNNQHMLITLWTHDDDYSTHAERQAAERFVYHQFHRMEGREELVRHRARQRVFYCKCMQQLKALRNATTSTATARPEWVLLTDTDEFLRINYNTTTATTGASPPLLPMMDQYGSVASIVRQATNNGKNISCLQIPRVQFGNAEYNATQAAQSADSNDADTAVHHKNTSSNRTTTLSQLVPRLATWRWRTHDDMMQRQQHRLMPKTLIRLDHVDDEELRFGVYSVHRPLRSICQRPAATAAKNSLLLLHHYIGSWEQYTFRQQDARYGKERTWEAYRKLAATNRSTSDEIVPWISGFIRRHGREKAEFLLENAGRLLEPVYRR